MAARMNRRLFGMLSKRLDELDLDEIHDTRTDRGKRWQLTLRNALCTIEPDEVRKPLHALIPKAHRKKHSSPMTCPSASFSLDGKGFIRTLHYLFGLSAGQPTLLQDAKHGSARKRPMKLMP